MKRRREHVTPLREQAVAMLRALPGIAGRHARVFPGRDDRAGPLRTFVGRGQMTLQIHGVMKEAQDLDRVAVRSAPEAEHDEMTPLARDVKREEPPQDVVPLFRTRYGRADSQLIERRRNRFGVDARLCVAELSHRPAQDFLEVGRGGRRQAHRPAARPCAHFERVAGFPPIALSASAVK